MWRWLPSVRYKFTQRQIYLYQIFWFVFLIHIMFLLGMIVSSYLVKKDNVFTISMYKGGATYVLMPFDKKIVKQSLLTGKVGSSEKSKIISLDQYNQQKKSRLPGSALSPKQKDAAVQVKKSITPKKKLTVQQHMQKNKSSAAVVSEQERARVVSKKSKKSVSKKKASIISEKHNVKVKQQTATIEHKNLKTDSPIQEEVTSLAPQSVPQVQDLPQAPILQDDHIDLDNVVFVGYEQIDECVIGSKIQQSIQQKWTPPVGIDDSISCLVRVGLTKDGSVSMIEIEKSSGIFVYDQSAKSALVDVEYPQEVWGKTIKIALGN